MGAVIDGASFKTQAEAIEEAKTHAGTEIVVGGGYDDSHGFFVEPTVIETRDPDFRLLRDELFGPVVTTYVYDEQRWSETIGLVDAGTPYGLTGAVVGQQPFGGARASGTNDKAGSMWNLIRWVSPRSIKETFIPASDYRYPFLASDTDGKK